MQTCVASLMARSKRDTVTPVETIRCAFDISEKMGAAARIVPS